MLHLFFFFFNTGSLSGLELDKALLARSPRDHPVFVSLLLRSCRLLALLAFLHVF